uniref:(northern house mosquito) hypothetical protein n=1 Tax=Culex pipiens TaxID=7175 RepID=A0A8D8C6D2_CULPI
MINFCSFFSSSEFSSIFLTSLHFPFFATLRIFHCDLSTFIELFLGISSSRFVSAIYFVFRSSTFCSTLPIVLVLNRLSGVFLPQINRISSILNLGVNALSFLSGFWLQFQIDYVCLFVTSK